MRQVLPRQKILFLGTLRLFLVGMMLFALCAPLSANLPYDCNRCSGTSECDCDGEGAGDDTSIDGDEGGVFGDGINGGNSSRGGASFGSLRFSVPFGETAHEPLRLGGQFSLYAVSASSLVYTTQYLQYRNRLLDRILQTEVSPAYKERILGSDWESRLESLSVFGRVVTDSSLTVDVTHQIRLLGAKREPIVFQFTLDDPVGRPIGEKATLRLTLRMRNASGNDTTSVPVYYDLCFGDGSSVRYAASDGRVVSCTTSKGRTVTPEDAGLEAVWDESGLIRQVRSDRDGLADVVAFTDAPGYEIRLYESSQITGKGEEGLYTVAGEPHTIWRIFNPNAGTATHVHITRIFGGTEETTVYEYSSNVEGWMKTSPDRATVVSSTSTVDLSRTLRTVTVTERTRTGTVASRTRNLVRKYSFGERLVSSTKDPDGATLQSVWEYYADSSDAGSYGRRKSESRPDGGWTLWRYDAQGRVSAEVTPWKNAAFGADDAEAQVVLRSYEPVDSRDTVAVTDIRPRTGETRILGTTTSKTYHAYYTEDGCRVEVTERCVRPNASYGDADNLRTVKRWYSAGDASSASAGRLHTVQSEDGLLSTYDYERGSWASGTFVAGSGNALQITETHGTAEHPEGIAFRTLRLVTVLDASGNRVFSERQVWTGEDYERVDRTERSFDGRNRLVRIEKSNGEVTENTWNCCSKASETTPDGKTYLYEYDTQHRLIAKTLRGVDGQSDLVTEYAYDASGNVLRETVTGGELSQTTSYVYDLAGRLLSFTDAAGLTTTRTYLSGVNAGPLRRGETLTTTLPSGAQSIAATYCDGRQSSLTGSAQVPQYYDYGVDAEGACWTLVHVGGGDSPRWAKTFTDPLGRVVRTERPGFGEDAIIVRQDSYDNAGRLVKTTETGSLDVLFEYDELGTLTCTGRDVDGDGILEPASSDRITETSMAYVRDDSSAWWERTEQRTYAEDDDATPTVVTIEEKRLSGFASGVIVEIRETDIHGNLTTTTVAVNRAKATVVVERLSPESSIAERQMTVNGRIASVRSRSGLMTSFAYDGLGRRISVTAPRTGTSTVAYDEGGRVTSETDAAGNAVSYGYDDAGRLAWKKNALGKFIRYAYDAQGHQTRIWGDVEYPVEYSYDQYGQRITMTTFRTEATWNGASWPNPAPQGDTTTWNYDPATGLLLSKIYADGHGPSYAYTPDGKLATRTWARNDAQGNPLVTTFTYTPFGELATVDYSDDTPDIAYTYNRAGKLSQVTDAAGIRTFAYNATLDEVSETISGLYSKTLTRGYDALGRRVSLSVDGVQHYAYGYDDFGRLNHIASFAGEFGYSRLEESDLVSRMTRPNGIATDWTYEPHRDLVTQVQNGTISTYGYVNDATGRRGSMSRSGSAYATPDVISYSYNDRGELTGAVSNVDATYSYSYVYDPIGNRISSSEAGVSRSYTTNCLNQYTSVMEGELELSFSYDMDGSMTYRPVEASSGWTQVWNCENRLVETSKGNTRLTFQYDYLGRRVEKCVYLDNALTSKIFYVYDGFKCVDELDALNGNAILARHLWQPPEAGLDVLLATSDASGISFFLHDANKNVMQFTDASGTLRESYSYAPFGESLGTTQSRIGFSSEVFDGQTSLVYYNYRYFLSDLGRWGRQDPIGEVLGNNLYVFCVNAPIVFYDNLGYFMTKECSVSAKRKVENWRFVSLTLIDRNDFTGSLGGAISRGVRALYRRVIEQEYVCTCSCPKREEYKMRRLVYETEKDLDFSMLGEVLWRGITPGPWSPVPIVTSKEELIGELLARQINSVLILEPNDVGFVGSFVFGDRPSYRELGRVIEDSGVPTIFCVK